MIVTSLKESRKFFITFSPLEETSNQHRSQFIMKISQGEIISLSLSNRERLFLFLQPINAPSTIGVNFSDNLISSSHFIFTPFSELLMFVISSFSDGFFQYPPLRLKII